MVSTSGSYNYRFLFLINIMEYVPHSIRYMKLTVSNIRIMSFVQECLSVVSCLIASHRNAIIERDFVLTLMLQIRGFLELEISSQIAELHHHHHHHYHHHHHHHQE